MKRKKITIWSIINLLIAFTGTFIVTWYNIKSVEKKLRDESMIIGFTGDVMLGRSVNQEIDNQNSFTYPWGNALHLLQKNDLNIINLETTLTKSEKAVPKVFNFKATPDKVNCLKIAKIDVVNLANNHILDFNNEGLEETIKTVDSKGILHVGAGKNIGQAKKPVIIEKKGIKIGIIGYTDNEPDWKATETKPGTNYIKVGDIDQIKKDISNLKSFVDILIVTIHWGPNMRQRPIKEFIDFAHQVIDAGADIIHGHSAHIFQGIEIYKSKLIMYDTGDFVDDYVVDPILRNDQSFLFLVYLEKDGIKKIKLEPVIIKNRQVNRANQEESEQIIQKMQKLSAEFMTKITDDGYIYIN